ncbi:HAMP domain-containing protein [bacterium]|nr:HAMP domain-containing protein [bacterium]
MFNRLLYKFLFAYAVVLIILFMGQGLFLQEFAQQFEQTSREYGIDQMNGFAANLERSLQALKMPENVDLARIADNANVREALLNSLAGAAVSPSILYASVHGRDGRVLFEAGQHDILQAAGWSPLNVMDHDTMLVLKKEYGEAHLDYLDLIESISVKHIDENNRESFIYGEDEDKAVETPVGFVRLGMDLSPLKTRIDLTNRKMLHIAGMISILSLAAILIMVGRMLSPIRRLQEATREIAAGDLDYRVDIDSEDEIGQLAKSFDEMRNKLKKIRRELELQADFLQYAGQLAVAIDLAGNIIYLNQASQSTLVDSKDGVKAESIWNYSIWNYVDEKDHARLKEAISTTLAEGRYNGELCVRRPDGSCFPFMFSAVSLSMEDLDKPAIIILGQDVTTLREMEHELKLHSENLEKKVAERTEEILLAYDKLKQAQSQVLQSEKMASIGQLAAGVAHEINNPVGFVKSNLGTLAEYMEILKKALEHYGSLAERIKQGLACDSEAVREVLEQIEALDREEDLNYILSDLDALIRESSEGVQRVKEIVQNLKSFARVDESESKEADLNEGIEATLKVVWNELKYKTTVIKNLHPLPIIRCNPGQLNQVFMNLLVNAAQAIPERGEIRIDTEATDSEIVIRISDTGTGIPEENISKLFDPFFTTKEVGKGTGLGLSISYGIIQKHNGTIEVDSRLGEGTTFTIRLPIVNGDSS